MAHLTVYVPEHLFRRYQDHWPAQRSLSQWFQEGLRAELERVEASEPAETAP